MRVLDLFCCAGGAGAGYARAGFEVVGIDIYPQPGYPFEFVRADAIEYVTEHGADFDFIHASPPCQGYSATEVLWNNAEYYPMMIPDVRKALDATGKPYTIENVERAAWDMQNPILLCGDMFGIRTYRHRLFECNWKIEQPVHPRHVAYTAKMGRPVKDGEHMIIAGNFSGVDLARKIMEMPWARRNELSEAIPPAYTEWIARRWMETRQ